MARIEYNKLVRDNIPDIIRENGGEPVYHEVPEGEFLALLREKMQEELNEYSEKPCVEELVDVLEVIITMQAKFDDLISAVPVGSDLQQKVKDIGAEFGSILEVVHSLAETLHITLDQLEAARQEKLRKNGGFTRRFFLEYVDKDIK